jgi:hypothetical protein
VLQAGRSELCHSAWFQPQAVLCEPALGSQGFASSYYVVGPVLNDWLLRAWLEGKALPTAR